MLKVKLLSDSAKVPTIAHPGEDLAYDLYSAESIVIPSKGHADIHTGVAIEFDFEVEPSIKVGFLIKERSSFAKNRLAILGGVVDSGYRGEVMVMMENYGEKPYNVAAGEKIANLIPTVVLAKSVQVYSDLSPALRGEGGFGSSDQVDQVAEQ